MTQPTIKICGITRLEDAQQAIDAGADFLGLIRAESARRVELDVATEIVRQVGAAATPVLLFQDAPVAEIVREIAEVDSKWVQLHGGEPRTIIDEIRQSQRDVHIIRAWPLGSDEKFSAFRQYLARSSVSLPDIVILDAEKGGAIPTADQFRAAATIVRDAGIPVWRAGGLNAENITAARDEYAYDGFDVASGVESEPGIKDALKMRRFVENARM